MLGVSVRGKVGVWGGLGLLCYVMLGMRGGVAVVWLSL